MRCLNCGVNSERYLCPNCQTNEVLDNIFKQIRFYNSETCDNPYLKEYASGLTEKYAERDVLPEIFALFDTETTEFYYCQYYRMRRDNRFEPAAISYIESHDLKDIRTQNVLYDLIESYIPNDFIKPKKWCEIISATNDLCCELYDSAAKFFAMIGEYDLSDSIVEKALELCNDASRRTFIFYSPENMNICLEKRRNDTARYRTKKPYWPKTEERRRAVAMYYDEKGIKYPRIENRPVKVPENEFSPINECLEDNLSDYCAFWCSEAFSKLSVKCIYQIAAVKVSNHKVIDSFESLIRPWDGGHLAREKAAQEIGVTLEAIESAEDVDIVLSKFFEFVGNSVLVSTGALGSQAKLISRAARYTGMHEIRNEFFDILDFAADIDKKFDLANNSRDFLCKTFSVIDGKNALEKAQVNVRLYDSLRNYNT